MSVRLKITFLFTAIVFCILGLAFVMIYLVSTEKRERYIDSRLTNLAITTGNFLSRKEYFKPEIISKIDSLTSISFTRKTIQAYDRSNTKIYSFNDDESDVVNLKKEKIYEVRFRKKIYTRFNEKDVVLYHYKFDGSDFVIVAAGYDLFGHDNLQDLFTILYVTFLGGIAIAFISGYIFSRQLLRPLGFIANHINEISVQNLAKRLNSGTAPDEWNYLTKTVNKLLDRLQESFETQGRFIANASHELSTPLASISSQLEITLQKKRRTAEYVKTMMSIQQDVHYLNKLTFTLLQFAKASGTPGGIEINPIRIDELLIHIVSDIRKSQPDYNALLEFDNLPENQETLVTSGNEELLYIAIKNIVINACKYSSNQQAKISLFVKENDIVISVLNIGDEIPENEFENIFLPFYRIEETRVNGGFGLGLSMTKRIINLHDGEINVSSVGEETVFTVILKNNTTREV